MNNKQPSLIQQSPKVLNHTYTVLYTCTDGSSASESKHLPLVQRNNEQISCHLHWKLLCTMYLLHVTA